MFGVAVYTCREFERFGLRFGRCQDPLHAQEPAPPALQPRCLGNTPNNTSKRPKHMNTIEWALKTRKIIEDAAMIHCTP